MRLSVLFAGALALAVVSSAIAQAGTVQICRSTGGDPQYQNQPITIPAKAVFKGWNGGDYMSGKGAAVILETIRSAVIGPSDACTSAAVIPLRPDWPDEPQIREHAKEPAPKFAYPLASYGLYQRPHLGPWWMDHEAQMNWWRQVPHLPDEDQWQFAAVLVMPTEK